MLQRSAIYAFRKKILRFYRKYGRTLPWRGTLNPYHVLVSEVMLQQTQVNRVIPYYLSFTSTFPTVTELAHTPVQDVLRIWSGLGYNSRAIRLQECAGRIVTEYGGRVPEDPDELQKLPGIGSYTAGAIAAFAYKKPAIFYDTNIRRVLIAGLGLSTDISKTELLEVLSVVLPKSDPGEWYNALMDYGALKLTAAKTNIPPLSRQSTFKGSDREVRGFLMKQLLKHGSVFMSELTTIFPDKNCTVIVSKMIGDGLPLRVSGQKIRLLSVNKGLKK